MQGPVYVLDQHPARPPSFQSQPAYHLVGGLAIA
ncbi:uncharacterized protein METZ01_LOCUS108373 [marine metagenome]|uniref:Uncharacterized protein n=1 Tax=marine metagenome TaxID=408172 RepID=A0A381WSN1_9ZZZZ